MKDLTEKTLSVTRAFTGRALTIDVAAVELPGGRRSVREIVRHRGAAVILGQLPDGRFVFIRQYRRAVEQTLLEAPAGCIEPGESPAACARREMEEESGYAVESLEPVGVILPSPGYSEERLHLFYARLPAIPAGRHLDTDENLETVLLTAAELDAALDAGRLTDAKSIAVWLLWNRRRHAAPARPLTK